MKQTRIICFCITCTVHEYCRVFLSSPEPKDQKSSSNKTIIVSFLISCHWFVDSFIFLFQPVSIVQYTGMNLVKHRQFTVQWSSFYSRGDNSKKVWEIWWSIENNLWVSVVLLTLCFNMFCLRCLILVHFAIQAPGFLWVYHNYDKPMNLQERN